MPYRHIKKFADSSAVISWCGENITTEHHYQDLDEALFAVSRGVARSTPCPACMRAARDALEWRIRGIEE